MSGEKYFTSKSLSYPRSFLGLLVAGFLLVALPLLGTLLYSAWHTQRLTEQSRSPVLGAGTALCSWWLRSLPVSAQSCSGRSRTS